LPINADYGLSMLFSVQIDPAYHRFQERLWYNSSHYRGNIMPSGETIVVGEILTQPLDISFTEILNISPLILTTNHGGYDQESHFHNRIHLVDMRTGIFHFF